MLLKLSPVTNLSDARFAAAAGFRYIGFCFDPQSPDFLLPIKAREIIDWTSGCHAVGEFGDQTAAEIRELSELLNLDVVLLNNNILPDEISEIGKPVIKVINTDLLDGDAIKRELEAYEPMCDAFQLNGTHVSDLLFWIEQANRYKIIWNLPVTADNILQVRDEVMPYAINLQGGAEEAAGVRDFEALQDILDKLEA